MKGLKNFCVFTVSIRTTFTLSILYVVNRFSAEENHDDISDACDFNLFDDEFLSGESPLQKIVAEEEKRKVINGNDNKAKEIKTENKNNKNGAENVD